MYHRVQIIVSLLKNMQWYNLMTQLYQFNQNSIISSKCELKKSAYNSLISRVKESFRVQVGCASNLWYDVTTKLTFNPEFFVWSPSFSTSHSQALIQIGLSEAFIEAYENVIFAQAWK